MSETNKNILLMYVILIIAAVYCFITDEISKLYTILYILITGSVFFCIMGYLFNKAYWKNRLTALYWFLRNTRYFLVSLEDAKFDNKGKCVEIKARLFCWKMSKTQIEGCGKLGGKMYDEMHVPESVIKDVKEMFNKKG